MCICVRIFMSIYVYNINNSRSKSLYFVQTFDVKLSFVNTNTRGIGKTLFLGGPLILRSDFQ